MGEHMIKFYPVSTGYASGWMSGTAGVREIANSRPDISLYTTPGSVLNRSGQLQGTALERLIEPSYILVVSFACSLTRYHPVMGACAFLRHFG